MNVVLKKVSEEHNLDMEKIGLCRTDVIKGIYEVWRVTGDENDLVDSLERAIKKAGRSIG